jgi:hypothetical protein
MTYARPMFLIRPWRWGVTVRIGRLLIKARVQRQAPIVLFSERHSGWFRVLNIGPIWVSVHLQGEAS